MDIVIPLGGVAFRATTLCTLKVTSLVAIVFQNEMDVAIGLYDTPDCLCQFREDVGRGVVGDRVNGVQPQAVEMIFGQPVEGIVNKEVADDPAFRAIKVNSVPPWRVMAISKQLWRVRPEIISF